MVLEASVVFIILNNSQNTIKIFLKRLKGDKKKTGDNIDTAMINSDYSVSEIEDFEKELWDKVRLSSPSI